MQILYSFSNRSRLWLSWLHCLGSLVDLLPKTFKLFCFPVFCVFAVCLCAQFCPCLWIIHSRFPLRYSLTFSLFCILCTQCCPCLWIIHPRFPLRYSLTFSLFSILCTLFFQFLWIVHSRFPPLDFSNVYLTLKRT